MTRFKRPDQAKLTVKQILKIHRRLTVGGEKIAPVAREYGMNYATFANIKMRRGGYAKIIPKPFIPNDYSVDRAAVARMPDFRKHQPVNILNHILKPSKPPPYPGPERPIKPRQVRALLPGMRNHAI